MILLFACYLTVIICFNQYDRFMANPTVISIEKDFRSWNGTLPAITFCYKHRIDDAKAASYIKRQWDVDTNHSEYEYFMEFINTVVYTAPDKLYVFLIFISDDRLKDVDLMDLVKQVG
jgi:Amiloride-sensitive sodium channel